MNNLEKIKKYLLETFNFDSVQVAWEIKRFSKHEDIAAELCRYLSCGGFTQPEITVAGYSARILCEKYPKEFPFAYEAYSFLILLREEPKSTLSYIKRGFPIK